MNRRRRRLSATAWHGEMFQSVFSHLITRRRHDVNAGPVSENFKFIYAVQPAQAHLYIYSRGLDAFFLLFK